MRWASRVCFALVVVSATPARAAPSDAPSEHDALSHLDDLKFELAGVFALITYSGIRDWKWGTAYWRFNSEGWFGKDTGSGGQDKLGHAYGGYVMSEFFYLRLRTAYGRRAPVTIYPPLFAWGFQLYIEVFDAFSVDHGFSYEDLIMDTVGVSAAFLRRAVPAIGRVVDYRLEYFPSGTGKGFHPMIDYEGQKFLLALRPGGVAPLSASAARFIELYLGYYTRGFKVDGVDETRRLYVGAGLDLQGIFTYLYRPVEEQPGDLFDYGMTAISLFQPPYPYPKLSVRQD